MTSAKEILSTTAAEQITSGLVELITVRRYERFAGAMLAADDDHRLMMEDVRVDAMTHLWSWTTWAGGRISDTKVTSDESTARTAVQDWLAEAPLVEREPGRDIFALILVEEDWR
ncbi:hypothetical protein AB1046_08080 [Promicromonospora sp. Populi]|uniref:hypothetical protein n=1 Tax=Promicromonospora sp. Populi TaxID=3239420 RepID=UPI0034E1C6F9